MQEQYQNQRRMCIRRSNEVVYISQQTTYSYKGLNVPQMQVAPLSQRSRSASSYFDENSAIEAPSRSYNNYTNSSMSTALVPLNRTSSSNLQQSGSSSFYADKDSSRLGSGCNCSQNSNSSRSSKGSIIAGNACSVSPKYW